MRDAPAGTSILQSPAEIDHRDRYHYHHFLNHKHLRQRQADNVAQTDATVTAATSTISVIQEIELDPNGSTVAVHTWLEASTTVAAPPDSTVPALSIPLSTEVAAILYTSANPGVLTTQSTPQSTPAVPASQVLPLTSAPYISANSSLSTGPASLSSSSFTSYSSNLSNHTSSTSLSSSSTKSTTSFTKSSSLLASLSSTSSSSAESYYLSSSPTPTVVGGAGAGSGPGASSASSSTSTAGVSTAGGTTDSSTSPSTPVVVGGVVGGIAGIVFIVALLMVLVRWRKRRRSLLRLNDSPSPGPRLIKGSNGDPSQPGGMIEKSLPFAMPAALSNLTGSKRVSQQPSVEASSSTAGSERGFYRVSGRKLPSVFQHGGDGYGGGHEDVYESLSGSSFYRDSRGFYGGPGSPVSPRAGRDSGIPITRPSPARTPVISEGAFGPPSPPAAAAAPVDPSRRLDALGRSHPSRDGSHGSKFTEEV